MSPKKSKQELHYAKQLRGIASDRKALSEKDEEEYNSAIRRSSRQKRLFYDSLNQSDLQKGNQSTNDTSKDDPSKDDPGEGSNKKRKTEHHQLANQVEAGDQGDDSNVRNFISV